MTSELLFARYKGKNLEPKNSFGAKWGRLIDALDLRPTVEGRRTIVKMHLGGGFGFSTVHPFLVRILVDKVKAAGAKNVIAVDSAGAVASAASRGYTAETIGCRLMPVSGAGDRYVYEKKLDRPCGTLERVFVAGEVADAEAMIDLSHIKGHGDAGFGGASKNLSMGAVNGATRTAIHALEGGLEWDEEKCMHCGACMENCPNNAINFKNDRFDVFYHHCKFCQHCLLICPTKAITMVGGGYEAFQRGMAAATSEVLKTFEPDRVAYINLLTQVTIFCDCWGMTTPSLVPDIGALAGRDIVAIEQASLDMIRTEDLIPGSLPEGAKLGDKGHLFERVHGKDPYLVVEYLRDLGWGAREYAVTEVE